MLKTLMDKADSMQGQMGIMSRDGNPKKEQKRNAREKKINRKEECIDELISRVGTTEERISELEDISIEASKSEKQRKQKLGGQKNIISKD